MRPLYQAVDFGLALGIALIPAFFPGLVKGGVFLIVKGLARFCYNLPGLLLRFADQPFRFFLRLLKNGLGFRGFLLLFLRGRHVRHLHDLIGFGLGGLDH